MHAYTRDTDEIHIRSRSASPSSFSTCESFGLADLLAMTAYPFKWVPVKGEEEERWKKVKWSD